MPDNSENTQSPQSSADQTSSQGSQTASQSNIVAQQQNSNAEPIQRPFIYDELRRVKNNANEASATKLGNTNKPE